MLTPNIQSCKFDNVIDVDSDNYFVELYQDLKNDQNELYQSHDNFTSVEEDNLLKLYKEKSDFLLDKLLDTLQTAKGGQMEQEIDIANEIDSDHEYVKDETFIQLAQARDSIAKLKLELEENSIVKSSNEYRIQSLESQLSHLKQIVSNKDICMNEYKSIIRQFNLNVM